MLTTLVMLSFGTALSMVTMLECVRPTHSDDPFQR
jgi:hypothetical protein